MGAANVPAQGMKGLGIWLEHPNHTNDKLAEVWNHAKAKDNPVALGKPDVGGDLGRDPVGTASLFDLPIEHWNYRPRQHIKSVFEVITDAPGMEAAAWDDAKKMVAEGRCKDLPPPLGHNDTEDELPCTMHVLICKNPADPEPHVILKHFTFLGNGRTMAEIKGELIIGDACAIDFRPDSFDRLRTFQIVLERMGGLLSRHWRRGRPSSLRGPVDEGDAAQKQKEFGDATQHIKDEAPLANWTGEQLLRAEQERCNPAPPIANVKKEFVNKGLQILNDRDHFAAKETYYPLLKGDIRKEYMPVVDRIIRTLPGNAALLIGEAKFGKTPLMYIMAMALARCRADCVGEQRGRAVAAPAVRVASEMDFCRGEARKRHEILLQISTKVGETWAPCTFDDGDVADQRPRALNAFFDPTQVEAN
ncbi:unnamed protein product, partial [Prorocentrum cordatum]